ncbi:MAG: O-methyltransferase [Bdellovibrio sp.]
MNTQLPMKSSITSENVARYVVEKIVLDSDLEKKLRLETLTLDAGRMISSSDVGSLLSILVQSIGAKKAIEIGTFTGYTALKMASALSENGILICCDISREWTDIGRRYWQEAGITQKIDLRIAPAIQTVNSLISNSEENTFDFAFIDADKTGYDAYYEGCLKLLRPGGLIVLDNMLWDGAVADPKIHDETTLAIRKLNEKISRDNRVNSCLMTVGDGLMLVRKK